MVEYWKGKIFCVIKLDWDYNRQTVDLSIPGYAEIIIHKYQHTNLIRPEHYPHQHNLPEYGKKIHYAEVEDTTPTLDKD